MFRKDLITILHNTSMDLVEIARLMDVSPHDAEDDLKHLSKSLKYSDYHLEITPAYCCKCGFKFHKEKLHKPSKCPQCHATWIEAPLLSIEKRH